MFITRLSKLRSLVVLTWLLFVLTFLAVSFHHHANQQINKKCPICSTAKYIGSVDTVVKIFVFTFVLSDTSTPFPASSTLFFFHLPDSIKSRSPPLR